MMNNAVQFGFLVLAVLIFTRVDSKRILANGLTANETKQILNLHNDLRLLLQRGKIPKQPRSIDMRKLCWDTKLAAEAQKVANDMIFEHQIKRDDRWVVGQNLEETTSSGPYESHKPDWNQAFNHWYSEVKRYTYGKRPIRGTGHYTQMVWAKTTHIGCGYTYYLDYTEIMKYRKLYVCNYGPSGNVFGEAPYKTGRCGCKGLCNTCCNITCRKKLEYYEEVVDNYENILND